jgi:competence protein CoiA
MKFALVDGHRREAKPGLSGMCPICGQQPMIAKCGEIRVWHWAYKMSRSCDSWLKPETEWHRSWKEYFPEEWQEFIQQSEQGERHRADVKTNRGWVIEFQHSYIKPEERRLREAFYSKLIWVVHGWRTRDRDQFARAWHEGRPVGRSQKTRTVFSDKCKLIREWAGNPAPVFFDFGHEALWLLHKSPSNLVYIMRFSHAEFIRMHTDDMSPDADNFDINMKEIGSLIALYESQPRQGTSVPIPSFPKLARRNFRPRPL